MEAVLHWAWDPIGVRGIPAALDEYDDYAPAVLAMLDRGATDREIADHLADIVHGRMALRPDPDREAAVAALLRELHAIIARAAPDPPRSSRLRRLTSSALEVLRIAASRRTGSP